METDTITEQPVDTNDGNTPTAPDAPITPATDLPELQTNRKVLLVDDEQNVINALKRLLRSENCTIFDTTDGREAISIARREQPALVICDMRMPQLSGVEVLQAIEEVAPMCGRVLLTGYADNESLMQAINVANVQRYLTKPWDEEELKAVVNEMLHIHALHEHKVHLEQALAEKVHELEELNHQLDDKVVARTSELEQANRFLDQSYREIKTQYLSAVKVFSNLMELRSPAMGGHSRRVAELARCLAVELELSATDIHEIYIAALLHDIGKIGLPDQVLLKPIAALDGHARAALMKHPGKAQKALMPLHDMAQVSRIIRHHHERYDGQGFPDGLIKKTIPLGSRILAVAEDFDELQLGWVASRQLTEEEALTFVQGSVEKRYDPDVVEKLPAALEKLRAAPKEDEKIVTATELKPGMVIMRDVISHDGILLLHKDGVVTQSFKEHMEVQENKIKQLAKIYVHKTKTTYVKPSK